MSDDTRLLDEGELSVQGRLVWSSNAAFLVEVCHGDERVRAIYKPRRGEAPLWDFPTGTLCQRERAAYLISEVLGWRLVPPTVLRRGPLGRGAVQLYIDHDPELHYLSMTHIEHDIVARLVAFDVVINNADRKSGHVLRGLDGHVWAIDHGVTFHAEPKLRTVIWDLAGERIPPSVIADLAALESRLGRAEGAVGVDRAEGEESGAGADSGVGAESGAGVERAEAAESGVGAERAEAAESEKGAGIDLSAELGRLLTPGERRALGRRLKALIHAGNFPDPDPSRRAIPWPPV